MAPSKQKQLSVLIAQRTSQRLSTDDQLKKIQSILNDADPGELAKLRSQLRSMKMCFTAVTEADQKIVMLIDDDEDDTELNNEIADAQQYQDKVNLLVSQAEINIEDSSQPTTPANLNTTATNNGGNGTKVKPKLPQLRLTPFSGDPLKWQEFWDTFESTVDSNTDLAAVDKFKYLKEFLKGNALLLAEGYRMTSANYDTVVEQLKQRYGDKESAIQAHFDALFSLRPASGDIDDLQRVFDECEMHIRSLVALDLDEETFGRVFAPLLKSKVPENIRLELERRRDGGPWTLSDLRQLFRSEINARRMSKQTFGGTNPANSVTTKTNSEGGSKPQWNGSTSSRGKFGGASYTSSASALVANGQRAPNQPPAAPCFFCGKSGHWTEDCRKYPDLASRKAILRGNCSLCLFHKHQLAACPQEQRFCVHCRTQAKHHRALCPQRYGNGASVEHNLNVHAEEFLSQANAMVSATVENRARRRLAVMQTALATVKGSKKSEKVRLLFDTASNRTFARTDLLKRIGANSLGVETLAVAGLGSERRIKKNYDSAELDLLLGDGSVYTLQVNGLTSISSRVQKQAIDLNKFRILDGMDLADPIVDRPELVQVDILIGLDNYYSLVGTEQCRIGDLAVTDTKVGLIISGCIPQESAVRVSPSKDTVMVALSMTPEQEMHEMVENLWRMESIGICDVDTESDDELAQRIFDDTVSMVGKRYQVRWPFKPNHPPLPSNYGLAHGRLNSLVRRLQRDPELFGKYDKIITEQISLGVVEEAPSIPEGEVVYYIPHQPELKPSSATTKVRVVYDATAKIRKDVPSLNECLFRGPVFLADLCGLLMRFRRHKIAIVSDIQKAFLQVGLPPSERDVTRFLWLKDIKQGFSNSNIKVFLRFCRVLFGLICSPFLLAAVIRHHLSKVGSKVSRQIMDNNYVDNVITGCSSLAEAKEYYREAKGMFTEASMNLREWYSNSPEFMEVVAENDRGIAPTARVLGLTLDLDSDQLACNLSSKHGSQAKGQVTKRIILRVTASLFDPCSYFAPITVRGKILLQTLWKLECNWDDDVPEAQQAEWNHFYADFQQIPSIKLQRFQGLSTGENCELHVFCDAANSAYGAAAYLRIGCEGPISCHLVFAKSRVSPIKNRLPSDPVESRLTIAKLELTALVVGSNMAQFVGHQLGIEESSVYIWSDSQCALLQVLGNAKKPVFVRNRVIQVKACGEFTFGYVPTEENPADLLTRNQVTMPVLKYCNLWWNGPAWLFSKPESWPTMPKSKSKDAEQVEGLLVAAAEQESVQVLLASAVDFYPIGRFSTWRRLLRVTAYMLRYVDIVKSTKLGRPKPTGPLLASEILRAKERCIRIAQQDICHQLDKKPTPQIVHQLGLTRDEDGFVRCSGKLDYSELRNSAKYPLFLPRDSPINGLLVDDVHQRLMHTGPTHMLAELRQEFWVVGARQQVRQVRMKCTTCRKAKGAPYRTPPSAPLPSFRSTEARSFSTVGIDYLGPVFIRKGEDKVKSWICLFTCGASRAVHLEVIADMTAEQFLLALRRFAALRGKPDLIICDNAKTFHTSRAVVNHLFRDAVKSEEVQGYASSHGIEWKFVVELAPWMGGFYERMVGLVKDKLRCVLQRRLFNLIELQTVCSEVVSILNSRPLTYCEDEVGAMVLTPKHLIDNTGTGFTSLNTKDQSEDPDYDEATGTTQAALIGKWKRIRAVVDQFWDTWQRQYLVALRERHWKPNNRGSSAIDATKGSVVLIKETNIPRGRWRIGRIVALETSFDGICRSSRVQLPDKSILRRPLKLLCPLEVPAQTENPQDQGTETTAASPEQPARPQRAAAIKALRHLRETNSDTEDF